ncbi:hypothetical protein [Fodinibius salsisoli]|uniref:Uncharacterized protein n=1 Tax=Fodinibius salsisoli TaxID=2820877 RepID=A0ABT3PTK9_9BACT|nr:hypothetical protein [Fodinibius salsisoli]MCW9709157.1 hypothetical protein [Fodinibius salsisoli]
MEFKFVSILLASFSKEELFTLDINRDVNMKVKIPLGEEGYREIDKR